MNEGTLPRELYQVPTEATIPVGHYYYLPPAACGVIHLGHTSAPYPPSERDPETTYFSLQRLQAKPLPAKLPPVEAGSFIYDVVTADGDEYEFGMRLPDHHAWDWVLLDPATGRADHFGSRLIEDFNLEPASADPLDESNKAPRVDSDGDVLAWNAHKERWGYFWSPGDEELSMYRTLREVEDSLGVVVGGFASAEQLREVGL